MKPKYIIIIFLVLALFLYFQCDGNDSEPNTTPSVKTKFEPVKPKNTPIVDESSAMDQIGTKNTKNSTKKEQNTSKIKGLSIGPTMDNQSELIAQLIAENKQKEAEYKKATDSMKDELYKKSLQLNKFTHTFDNDKVKLTVSGIARGTVESIGIDSLTIKPQKIKQPVFTLLGGVEVGINKELNQGTTKVNLGFQNKKRDVISASYQKVASQEFYLVGFSKSIWTVKR